MGSAFQYCNKTICEDILGPCAVVVEVQKCLCGFCNSRFRIVKGILLVLTKWEWCRLISQSERLLDITITKLRLFGSPPEATASWAMLDYLLQSPINRMTAQS